MVLDDLEDGVRDVRALVPALLVPGLQLVDVVPDLDVQLDVLREPGRREVAGTDERITAWHIHRGGEVRAHVIAEMRDVGFRVELAIFIYAAFDLSALECFNDCGNSEQEIVLGLFRVQTCLHLGEETLRGGIAEDGGRTRRHLVSEDDAYLVQLLPLRIQGKKSADFKISRRNIQLLRYRTPFGQVPFDVPCLVGVIDNVQAALWHRVGLSWGYPCLHFAALPDWPAVPRGQNKTRRAFNPMS